MAENYRFDQSAIFIDFFFPDRPTGFPASRSEPDLHWEFGRPRYSGCAERRQKLELPYKHLGTYKYSGTLPYKQPGTRVLSISESTHVQPRVLTSSDDSGVVARGQHWSITRTHHVCNAKFSLLGP